MIIGGHVSIVGGIAEAPGRARALGLDAMQVFSKNQKRWTAPSVDPAAAEAFRAALETAGIAPAATAIHTSYLINLAATDEGRRKKSRTAFLDELTRAGALGIPLLIFHPGSHLGAGAAAGVAAAGAALREALEAEAGAGTALLIETTAGQGDCVGHSFEEIRDMIAAAGGHARLGVCYDICHSFAAGYDIRTPETCAATLAEFDRVIGLDRLRAMHLNDSKTDLGSRRDRHEHIGEGAIGRAAFGLLLGDRRFTTLPAFMETPEAEAEYPRNLAVLKHLVKRRAPRGTVTV
ncbi:MAG: deoxyribonuclease IV [Planctomycetota bacterium]